MKIRDLFISLIALVIWLSLALAYNTAHAGLIDWLTGGSKTYTYTFEEPVKTLESEIERLSVKYDVATSTVYAIINCESQMYGSAVNHNRLPDGTIWSTDFGPFQVNDYFHEERMTELGLDIHNQFDSLEYGFMLIKDQGLTPWKASKMCWSKLI